MMKTHTMDTLLSPLFTLRGPSQDEGAASFVSVATGVSPTKQQSPIYRTAVDYVGSVRKAYENNPKIYTEFLSALEQYHGLRYGSSYKGDPA